MVMCGTHGLKSHIHTFPGLRIAYEKRMPPVPAELDADGMQ